MPDTTPTEARLAAAAVRADRRLESIARADAALSRVRVALGVGIFAALLVLFTADAGAVQAGAAGVAAVLLAAFVVAARRHGRLDRTAKRWRAWRQIRLDRRARTARDWDRLPPPLDARAPADHPFAGDLQVLGPRSLHHLIDAAGTDGGRRRLAEWLLTTAPDAAAIADRQALVRDLVAARTFRDRLALTARLVGPVDTRALGTLAGQPDRVPALQRALVATGAALALTVGLAVGFALGAIPPLFVFGYLAYALVYVVLFRDLTEALDEASTLERSLGALGRLFAVAERAAPRGERLEALLEPFSDRARRPSAAVRRVERVVAALSVRQNGLLWVILNGLGPWDVWFTLRLARLQREVGAALPAWVEAWSTLEAAASLAEFADLNAAPFPSVAAGATAFRGERLVHPLLPPGVAVPNSFAIETAGHVAIVTGSNMSGKSTFLRTLGSNLVLATAGGPVTGAALAVAPMRLTAILNVADSVQDGISYFYAEVRRMRQLLDAVGEDDARPVFFLIDEILRGTNNRERFQGSRAIVEALAASGRALGVLSTHDLDLARIGGAAFTNLHFRDDVADGVMTFDYTLHDGPSTTTNALRVMAAAGLPTGETL